MNEAIKGFEELTNEQIDMDNITLRKDSWRGMDTIIVFFNEDVSQEEKYQILNKAKEYGKNVHSLIDCIGTHWGANCIEVVYGTDEEYARALIR